MARLIESAFCFGQYRFVVERVRVTSMEKQQHNLESMSSAVSPEAPPMGWVAPLQSIRTFSIAELTQAHSSPGDDGNGTFTGS